MRAGLQGQVTPRLLKDMFESVLEMGPMSQVRAVVVVVVGALPWGVGGPVLEMGPMRQVRLGERASVGCEASGPLSGT